VESLFAASLHISDFVQTQNDAKILTDKIKEISHSRHTTITKSFIREPSYIEITPYTPQHIPPTENASQLIPKQSPIDTRIWTLNTFKGPDQSIHYIPEGDCESELPQ
jgi:hypothetical protein